MLADLLVILWIVSVIAFALWAGSIAARKGRSRHAWNVAGLLFGIFAVVLVALLPTGGPPCPACRKPLHPQATVCPWCRSERALTPHRKDLRDAARAAEE